MSLATLAPRGIVAAPAFPVSIALAVAPVAAVLQSKAMAPVALVALLLSVVAYWRRHRTLPWPGGGALWAALALAGWGATSAAWSVEPGRSLEMGISLGAMALLGAGAARAVAEDEAEAKRLLARCLLLGLVAGLALAALDWATGNAVRAAVRGLQEVPATLAFGLKPAASVMAMLLPLAVAVPGVPGWARGLVLAGGAAVLLALPGDSAKLATLAGLAAAAGAAAAPRSLPRAVGGGLAALLLAAPLVLGAVFARGVPGDVLPPSAAHRLLIWDFAIERIAERPVLGWGLEGSRAIPGGEAPPPAAALDRFGLTRPDARAWFTRPGIESMPLHPHNGALQIWLELGLVGAALAAMLAWRLGAAATAAPHVPAATGALAAAAVTGLLSFGTWQPWWIASQLLALAALAGLPRREPRPPSSAASGVAMQ